MKPYGASTTFVCRGCSRTFRSQGSLSSHEKVCSDLKMGKGESFFKLAPLQQTETETADKILPASQPLHPVLSDTTLHSSQMGFPTENDAQTTPDQTENLLKFAQPRVVVQDIGNKITLPLTQEAGATDSSTSDASDGQQLQPQEVTENTIPTANSNYLQNWVTRAELPAPIIEEEGEETDPNCPICREEVEEGQPGICCDLCKSWFHRSCLHMTEEIYECLEASSDPWYCVRCLSIKGNKIKWGNLEGEEAIKNYISIVYKEITSWNKNIFMLPRGKAGTEVIKELTRLICLFVDDTKWSRISLALVFIFLPLVMQKPSSNSKAKENSKYLETRLKLWSEGNVEALLAEGREIQNRLRVKMRKRKENKEQSFCRLMLLGKIGPYT